MSNIITLTTDFGYFDEYVGLMKGVILSHSPTLQIVDLTHAIPRHNIGHGAYVLHAASHFFPPETVHIIVVDPGVGSTRRIVLLEAKGQRYIGPDNGVFTLFIVNNECSRAFLITNETLFRKSVSNTFHGRDIMAPVAARICTGMPLQEVGPEIKISELKSVPLPSIHLLPAGKGLIGSVVSIDNFGNSTTNITREQCRDLFKDIPLNNISVTIKNHRIKGITTSYANVPQGSVLAIFGSREYLEIAINQGNAAHALQIQAGDNVELKVDGPFKSQEIG